MTGQKTMNKFEATAAMVRDGVRVVDEIGRVFEMVGETIFTNGGNVYSNLSPGRYTIYQEPPKMKTWYRGNFFHGHDSRPYIWTSDWLGSEERVKSMADNFNALLLPIEERQFPEVG